MHSSAPILTRVARALFLAALACPDVGLSQTIQDGGDTVPATNLNVAPAVVDVPVDSAASGVNYFQFEAAQLTDDVIANLTALNLTDASLFSFGEPTVGTVPRKRSVGARTGSTNISCGPCKAFPGLAGWPSKIEWLVLEILLGGALIKAVPVAAPCFSDWPQYDSAKCSEITDKWSLPPFQSSQPTGIDWPLYEGVSCMPPTLGRTGATCTLGGLPSYVVKVTNVAQIQLVFNFARHLNLRVTVKNKGHDFNAKSVGAGSISIWTNFLDTIQYLGATFTSGSYTGPAFKIGAGVGTMKVYEAADALDLVVVAGIARTVGLGGGYIAGGGHSPLASLYGMGADQVLSMEVVLPDGRFVSASEDSNPDLFWALRGGGGGTFGVVTSLVIRAYPKQPVTTLTYSFGTNGNISSDTFWAGMDAVWATFPEHADAGQYRYWSIGCSDATTCGFSMAPHWANNMNKAQLQQLNDPLFASLAALGITVDDAVYTEYDGLLNAFNLTFPAPTEVVGTWAFHTGSRLFPRSNWEDPAALAVQSAAIRDAAIAAGFVLGYNLKAASNPTANQDNAVNPAWRETLAHIMVGASWGPEASPADIAAASEVLTQRLGSWRDASPGAGAYMNEADINEPNFQQSFYGSNYARLYALKQQYDPHGILYAPTAVGSEDWYITGQIDYYPTQNGRLCRVPE